MPGRKMIPPARIAKAYRSRVSSIDRLPPSAEPVIEQATRQLRQKTMTKGEILVQMNASLVALRLKPISRSAFFRWSVAEVDWLRQINGEEEIMTACLSLITAVDDMIASACGRFIAAALAQSIIEPTDAGSIAGLTSAFQSAVRPLAFDIECGRGVDQCGQISPRLPA